MTVNIGTMDTFVAARAPAGAAVDARGVGNAIGEARMVFTGNDRAIADGGGMFEMALQAEISVALDEHLLVDRAVRVMAGGAALAHGVVFKNERSFLRCMACGAGFSFILETGCAPAFDGVALVRVVALGAAHFAGEDGMAVRQAEFAAFIEMTLKAGFRRFAGIDDGAFGTTGLNVLAAGTVAALAAEAFGVFALDNELGVGSGVEALDGFLVALGAFLGTHKRGASDLRRGDHRAIHHRAGNKKHGPQGDASENDCILWPTTRFLGHGTVGWAKPRQAVLMVWVNIYNAIAGVFPLCISCTESRNKRT